MNRRLGLAGALLLAVGGPVLPAQAAPVDPANGAQASAVVRGEGDTRFLVRFTVVRGAPGAGTGLGTALLSQVFRCSLAETSCPQAPVSEQITQLPDRALSLGAQQGAAVLRAIWAGRPLTVTWKPTGAAGPRPTHGDTLVADDGNAKVIYEDFRLANASASVALLGGRGCRAPQPFVVTATVAAATWATTGGPQQSSPDSVPGLLATQGRCG